MERLAPPSGLLLRRGGWCRTVRSAHQACRGPVGCSVFLLLTLGGSGAHRVARSAPLYKGRAQAAGSVGH